MHQSPCIYWYTQVLRPLGDLSYFNMAYCTYMCIPPAGQLLIVVGEVWLSKLLRNATSYVVLIERYMYDSIRVAWLFATTFLVCLSYAESGATYNEADMYDKKILVFAKWSISFHLHFSFIYSIETKTEKSDYWYWLFFVCWVFHTFIRELKKLKALCFLHKR